MTRPIRVAIVGMGKIAVDHHLPAIAATDDFKLVAAVSRDGEAIGGLPMFRDIAALAQSGLGVDAVALCTPPQPRRAIAASALQHGWHVFLEKPPGATLAEVDALQQLAQNRRLTLFASWHSRYAAGVEGARGWLASRSIRRATITWREDVRVWHPGQEWMWEPGGFGVFDPGINAISIVTRILPRPIFVVEAELDFPSNRQAPIAARIAFRDTEGVPISMDLDFRQEGEQSWDIVVETDLGALKLRNGGAALTLPGDEASSAPANLQAEYRGLYARFAEVVRAKGSDVDITPLQLVADAFMCGRAKQVEAFWE